MHSACSFWWFILHSPCDSCQHIVKCRAWCVRVAGAIVSVLRFIGSPITRNNATITNWRLGDANISVSARNSCNIMQIRCWRWEWANKCQCMNVMNETAADYICVFDQIETLHGFHMVVSVAPIPISGDSSNIAIADTWFICAHNIQRRSEFIVCALMQSTHNDDNNKKHDAIKYGFSLFRMATHNFAWAFLLLCTIFMNSTCVLHVGWTFYRQIIRESIPFNPIRGRWYSTWSKCAWKWFNSFHSESLFIPFHYFWMEKNANIADTKKPLTYTHTFMHQSKTSTEHICLRIALL